MLKHSPSSAASSSVCAQALTLFRIVEGYLWSDTHPLPPCSVCVCSGTCPLLPCCGVPVLRHSPPSALLWGAGAQALPSYPLLWAACAQALALFHLVEESPCSARCPLLICCGMPVLRHLPSSAFLWGACPQTLALFHIVEGCLCSGSRPSLPHCVVPMLRQLPSSALLRDA